MRIYRNILIGMITTGLLFTAACSDDNNPGDPVEPVEDDYVAPDYADDYSAISSWSMRSSWNLANVHDPSVVKFGDYYYMYGTDASYGNAHTADRNHYTSRRSKDLVNWDFLGMTLPEPTWLKDSVNTRRAELGLPVITEFNLGYWAPVVREVNGTLRMYYSVVVSNYIGNGKPEGDSNFDNTWTERAFIGLAESTDPANNNWVDKGYVISSVSDRTDVNGSRAPWYRSGTGDWDSYFLYNAIDPSFIVTPEGEHWLIYGSWHSGIVATKVDPSTGKPYQLDTLSDYGTPIARRYLGNSNNRWQGQEAPEIIYKDGYYYLFLAYDALGVPYNTRVCRSKSITGPYLGINGGNVTNGAECWPMLTHPYKFSGHSGWVGISHCCVFEDGNGNWYYSSQGRLPVNTNGNVHSNAIMMGHVNQMRWIDGWPIVMPERYAAVPDNEITADDLVGTWECIVMDYQYEVQQASSALALSAQGNATGKITGTWSYDTAKKELKVGNYTLAVERGLDWEASPRTRTIIFSGLTNDGKPIWGKMK